MIRLSLKLIFGKPLTLTLVLLLVGTIATAGTGEKTNKTDKDPGNKTEKSNTTDESGDKRDSVGIAKSNVGTSILTGYHTSYKSIEADSIQNSNEVLSFNFIQYMIQRFKFSDGSY